MSKESGRQSTWKFVLATLGVTALLGTLATGLSWASFLLSLWLLDSDD